jgi:hypothetical protein
MRQLPPALAEWVLLQIGASDALIGDLHEAFIVHRSGLWYWHQVVMALFVALRCHVVENKWRTFRDVVGAAGATTVFVYTVACGPNVNVTTGLKVEAVTSGWKEMETIAGETKLVPAISFRLRNVSGESLPVLQVNAVFRRGHDEFEWGNAFQTAAGSAGLAPGAATRDLLLSSGTGYTSTDAAPDLLENSHFVDARVDLFGRYASTPWTKVGEYAIPRTLIDR